MTFENVWGLVEHNLWREGVYVGGPLDGRDIGMAGWKHIAGINPAWHDRADGAWEAAKRPMCYYDWDGKDTEPLRFIFQGEKPTR